MAVAAGDRAAALSLLDSSKGMAAGGIGCSDGVAASAMDLRAPCAADSCGRETTKPADPRSWSEVQLAQYLASRGLPPQITDAFQVHLVNGLLAADIRREDLQAMGVLDALHQRRLLVELSALFEVDMSSRERDAAAKVVAEPSRDCLGSDPLLQDSQFSVGLLAAASTSGFTARSRPQSARSAAGPGVRTPLQPRAGVQRPSPYTNTLSSGRRPSRPRSAGQSGHGGSSSSRGPRSSVMAAREAQAASPDAAAGGSGCLPASSGGNGGPATECTPVKPAMPSANPKSAASGCGVLPEDLELFIQKVIALPSCKHLTPMHVRKSLLYNIDLWRSEVGHFLAVGEERWEAGWHPDGKFFIRLRPSGDTRKENRLSSHGSQDRIQVGHRPNQPRYRYDRAEALQSAPSTPLQSQLQARRSPQPAPATPAAPPRAGSPSYQRDSRLTRRMLHSPQDAGGGGVAGSTLAEAAEAQKWLMEREEVTAELATLKRQLQEARRPISDAARERDVLRQAIANALRFAGCSVEAGGLCAEEVERQLVGVLADIRNDRDVLRSQLSHMQLRLEAQAEALKEAKESEEATQRAYQQLSQSSAAATSGAFRELAAMRSRAEALEAELRSPAAVPSAPPRLAATRGQGQAVEPIEVALDWAAPSPFSVRTPASPASLATNQVSTVGSSVRSKEAREALDCACTDFHLQVADMVIDKSASLVQTVAPLPHRYSSEAVGSGLNEPSSFSKAGAIAASATSVSASGDKEALPVDTWGAAKTSLAGSGLTGTVAHAVEAVTDLCIAEAVVESTAEGAEMVEGCSPVRTSPPPVEKPSGAGAAPEDAWPSILQR
eukprot:TRINITY_DN11456_c0_g1_i1.p1 TRINITY_DN11456_c0_g1~~TRINITY_DN11456_c0_g1_i1.p1  ORF type:complete len:836 (+),score=198.89 TRINITY_DN11456_c0_g1_i1:75-2582(+)